MSTVKNLVRETIINTMIELLRKNNIKYITINDIAEAAGVSRMTVYRHFKDKYEIETAIYERDCGIGYREFEKDGDLLKLMLTSVRAIVDKRDVYRNMFEDRTQQNSFFEGWIEATRKDILSKLDSDELTEELKVAMYYLLYGGFYTSWAYIQNKIDMTEEELIQAIFDCWPESIKKALKK